MMLLIDMISMILLIDRISTMLLIFMKSLILLIFLQTFRSQVRNEQCVILRTKEGEQVFRKSRYFVIFCILKFVITIFIISKSTDVASVAYT